LLLLHGSGKTAVLVERIIQKIINDKIDINKLLVVTFTNAAASEMRERVLDAIYKKLDETPDDENLQKQIILLSKSNICTIHSFCLEVIKNNFFEINFPANFRIASEEEIELLRQEVLEDTFENLYENDDENFIKLVECYSDYKGDDNLKELVLKIYRYIQSSPFPRQWLEEKVEMFFNEDFSKDFGDSLWGKVLLENLREELTDSINSLKNIKQKVDMHFELEKYSLVLQGDIEKLLMLNNISKESFDKAFEYKQNLKFDKWPIDKKVSMELKEEAKGVRDVVKKKIIPIIEKILFCTSEEAFKDLNEMYDILSNLKDFIFKFDDNFKNKKREKNIIDFSDIEHFALDILVKKDENGNYIPSDVAKTYRDKFEEIAIDEYQDSNEVQEYILSTISRGNNIFMVGDVKQSIYKFRQACPELFLNKYESYSKEGNDSGIKIQLFKNFRSKENILDITNIIFKELMSKTLGDIDYTEEEYLNLGAEYEKIENELTKSEINLIEIQETEEETEEIEEEQIERQLKKEEIEAKFIAKRIEELINNKYKIKDKKQGIRNIEYRDIVILLRATSKTAPIYEKELINNNIPVFSDASNEYLDTIEIQTIINLLKVLDNPTDDIALVSVLRSEIGGFSDNEILEIRLYEREKKYYYSLKTAKEQAKDNLKEKVTKFLNAIKQWRFESEYLGLAELIWKIYLDTGYYNYVGLMPNGTLRKANLKMLFERAKDYERTSFKGLFNFIRFIEKVKLGNSDMSSAKTIGENENVVRIMSIHKSKGLEFPVVFLSATSKKFNFQDLNESILLHQKLGIGPEYINYNRRIEYPTLAKEAIKIVSKNETISEEMRVLYVALTRAKEKLIITGTLKDAEKDLSKKEEYLKIYENSKNISPILLKKYNSYLDWINLVLLKNRNLSEQIDKRVYKISDLVENKNPKENEKKEFKFEIGNQDFNEIIEAFNWEYKYTKEVNLPIKSTVSKIKEDIENKEIENVNFEEIVNKKEIGIENITPSFYIKEKKFSNANIGTIAHLFLQKLDFKEVYTKEELINLKEKLIKINLLTEEEADTINIEKVLKFVTSDFYKKLLNSKKIEKEKPFCIKMSAKELGLDTQGDILVQGIIDFYAIDDKDEIILVDYKTDFALNEENLIEKYKKQLEIYKMALEEGLDKKVSEVYIYSLFLDKEIKLNI